MRIEFEGRIINLDEVYAKRLIASGRAVQVSAPDNLVKKEVQRTPEGGVKSPGRPPKNKEKK